MTAAITGLKRILSCLAISASLSLAPALAAGEQDRPPPGSPVPADLAPPPKPRITSEAPRAAAPRNSTRAEGGPRNEGGQRGPVKIEPGRNEAPRTVSAKAEASKAEAPDAGVARPAAASGIMPQDNTASDASPVTAPVLGRTVSARTGDAADDPLSGEGNSNARKYCTNIAAAATDARFAWQSKKLLELETKIKTRIAELDTKEAELKSLLDRREEFSKKARETLVGIYAKMNPETAASQIGALDDEMATAVLAALTPRQASAIFDQIAPPERAAKLAGLLANPLAPPADKKL